MGAVRPWELAGTWVRGRDSHSRDPAHLLLCHVSLLFYFIYSSSVACGKNIHSLDLLF